MYAWLLATLFTVQSFQYCQCVTNNSSNDRVFTLKYKSFYVDFTLKHFLKFLRCLCDGNRQTCHVMTSPDNEKQNFTYNVTSVSNKDKVGFYTSNLTVSCTLRENQMGNKETNLTMDCNQSTEECHAKITITQSDLLKGNNCLFNCFSINWLLTDAVEIIHFNSDIILMNNCTTQCREQTTNINKVAPNDEKHNLSHILLPVITVIIAIAFIIYLLRRKLKKLYIDILKTCTSPQYTHSAPLQGGLAVESIYPTAHSVKNDGNFVKNKFSNRRSTQTNTVTRGCGRETMTFEKSNDLSKSNGLEENYHFKNVESINGHIYMDPDLVGIIDYDTNYDISNKPELCGGFSLPSSQIDNSAVENTQKLLHSDISVYEKTDSNQYYDLELNENCEINTIDERAHADGVRYELACPSRDPFSNGNPSDLEGHVYSRLGQREEVLVNEFNVLPIKK